jgi:predicted nuclease of predicted toxin-antitoxin system
VKILLDECMPKRLAREFSGHEVRHVSQMGWAAIKNGRLLALAEKSFDVFVTVDRNMSFQQRVQRFHIAVLVVHSRSNRRQDLLPLVPQILSTLPKCKAGQVTTVG